MTEAIVVERDGDVVTWTLNRPETRNVISEPDVIEAFEAAIADVNRDVTVRAAVLTAAGPSFSSGGNVKHMRDQEGMFGGSPAELRGGYRHGIQRIPRALYHCEVPV
ncbi:enoyl-CoA hydratase-related protein, partial [Rhodococcus sp. NPDC058514]